eukprot:m.32585 g.32585  ORF g.32585 m.32585 type:complete len:112 (-) comp6392_c0_seq3:1061-1396(-)
MIWKQLRSPLVPFVDHVHSSRETNIHSFGPVYEGHHVDVPQQPQQLHLSRPLLISNIPLHLFLHLDNPGHMFKVCDSSLRSDFVFPFATTSGIPSATLCCTIFSNFFISAR